MSNKLFFYNQRKQKLCGILEEPNLEKSKVIIMVHGYSSDKEGTSIKDLSEKFTEVGINSFRIDLNGCGESEGKFEEQTLSSAVRDIGAAIELMKSMGYNEIGLFGSSMAGPPCMTIALKYPDLFKMALKAPVSDILAQRKKLYGDEHIEDCKKRGYTYYINKKKGKKIKVNYHFFEDAEDYIMHAKVKNIEVPTLIIHGTADNRVDISFTKNLVKDFPAASLIIIGGADHALEVNGSREEGVNRFLDWFQQEGAEEEKLKEENDNN